MHISLKQLEIFVAVAKLNTVTQAAATLYISQAACSMALSNLESQLNVRLFDRQGKRLLLNEIGQRLFAKAVNILEQTLELQNIAGGAQAISGSLSLGASTTIGNYLLPDFIYRFCQVHPIAHFNLTIENSEQVIQDLLKFKLDVGLIEHACQVEDLTVIPWRVDELAVIASPQHPLARKRKITHTDLLQAKWILREAGSGTREHFEQALGEVVKPFLELNQTEAIKQAVTLGMGISCLSKTVMLDALKQQQLICLKTPFLKLTRPLSIVINQARYQSALLTAFLDHLGS